MKVLYERSFLKDLKKRKDKALKKRVESVIVEIKQAKDRSKLSALEKLKGHESAYKIRLGDYRMGIFLENDTVIFSRFLHRKEIYKKFP
jgi:mRNA interferase RelE/StbE